MQAKSQTHCSLNIFNSETYFLYEEKSKLKIFANGYTLIQKPFARVEKLSHSYS
jgi:hypothetical protein